METEVETDHSPLQWIKTSPRGKLSPFMVEKCGSMSYYIKYKDGKRMLMADPGSRTPFVARPGITVGTEALLSTLLSKLDSKIRAAVNLWVWHEKDTAAAARQVATSSRQASARPCVSLKLESAAAVRRATLLSSAWHWRCGRQSD
jgi:hypothetical protein